MKFHETNFEEYLMANSKSSLHPKLEKIYNFFPKKIEDLQNLIFYGPSGAGKYTQMLSSIHKYSPSQLKYEKKISVTYNKNTFFFKISDIHYEIDLSILGCHSKQLWNDVYNQIVDIILVKPCKVGIIVCKNFHDIHIELLETFYSYMQTILNGTINLKFILLTESVSFIPDNIINCCKIIKVPRPSKIQYNKCFVNKIKKQEIDLEKLSNLKHIHSGIIKPVQPYDVICNNIYTSIINIDSFNFYTLREQLYDILIYNLNVEECFLIIIERLVQENKINGNYRLLNIMEKMYDFLKNYNNNYRPIYHLERIAINLMQTLFGKV
jgi:hypothetical protein